MPPKFVHIQFSNIDRYLGQKQVFRITGSRCQSDSKESLQGEGSQVSPIVRLALANKTTAVSAATSSWNQSSWHRSFGCSQLLNLPLCKTGSMKHVYWCEMVCSVDCERQRVDHIQHHLSHNSTQPQITELHRPSDKSLPPPTLGMEWHWTGVKSIYLISVMGLF